MMKKFITVYIMYVFLNSICATVCSRFRCVDNLHCIKIQPCNNETSYIYYSLNHCRLSCGKYGSIWPQPTGPVDLDKQTVEINLWNTKFTHVMRIPSAEGIKFLNETKKYFFRNLRRECGAACTNSTGIPLNVEIVVTTSSTELTWATDETYSLNLSVAESGSLVANILANTIYGARHACETLLQLIVVVDEYSNYTSSSLHALSRAKIVDQPAYAHRGLLIDTARNFIPVKLLKKQLDAMATSKMNVFHWHVTDTQSFPLMIDRIPEMVSYGAYSSDAIYTPNEVKDVIQYAKYRGIRVILEFDGPAHAGNGWQWGPSKGLGNLALCINQQPWRNYCIEPPCGQLNIINPNLYTVLQDIFQYMANANLGEQVFHMGGDEIFLGCWNSTEEIVSFMLERGMGRSEMDFLIIWSEYQNKALQLWKNTFYSAMQNQSNGNNLIVQNSPSVVLWSSHLTDPSVIRNFLSNEQYVIQTWLPSSSSVPKELLALGYKLIISTKNAWYLDHGFWGKTTYYNWKTVYDNQLALEENILGGEVCAWTEFIDKHSLESRIWPRAAAAAERLWSNPDTRAVEAESRFFRHRNRLITRGIQPEAIAPKWCEQNESQCH